MAKSTASAICQDVLGGGGGGVRGVRIILKPHSQTETRNSALIQFFTITADMFESSLANFHCQWADRQMNL